MERRSWNFWNVFHCKKRWDLWWNRIPKDRSSLTAWECLFIFWLYGVILSTGIQSMQPLSSQVRLHSGSKKSDLKDSSIHSKRMIRIHQCSENGTHNHLWIMSWMKVSSFLGESIRRIGCSIVPPIWSLAGFLTNNHNTYCELRSTQKFKRTQNLKVNHIKIKISVGI